MAPLLVGSKMCSDHPTYGEHMVGVVQLANTSDCDSEDRGFEPRPSPHKTDTANKCNFNALILGIMYAINYSVLLIQ